MVAWWYSKANRILLRVLALVVSSVFFFTQVVGASVPDRSFWRERRKSRQKLLASREKPRQSDRRKGLGKKLEEKDVAGEVSSLITPHNLFTVPSQYGTVKEVHTQGSSKKPQGIGNRLIIHIQDAHSSPEAQLNSANILKHLQNGVAGDSILPLLICVEGSSGFVDTTLLATFPRNEIREKVARRFLMEGKITGEEYFAIVKGKKAPVAIIYGVEDKRAYEKNLKAFDEGLSPGERLRNYLQKVRQEINPLKARLYSKRLKALESKIEAYQKKRISLSRYCQYLHRLSHSDVGAELRTRPGDGRDVEATLLGRPERQSDRLALSGVNSGATRGVRETTQSPSPASAKYPNFKLFVEASKFEKKIDFSRVDSERSKYIKELSEKLTNDELSDLLIMSLDYRLGKVTSGEYYTYLQSLSSRMGKGVRSQDPRILTELVTSKEGKNEYPNLNLYIKYNKLYDRIDQNKLFSEISELEQELKERLCEGEDERELVKLSKMLNVLEDLSSLQISNEDLAYYHKHRDEITQGMFSNFITAHNVGATLRGRPVGVALRGHPKETGNVGATFMAPEDAGSMNRTLTEWGLPKFEEFYRIALKRNEALVDNTISRMEKIGSRVAVLIAGGFHTPGITKLLRDRNISYVVVTPRLGDNDSSDGQPSPRKKRTDFEKAIAGIIGALRPASLVVQGPSFSISPAIHYYFRSLIADSKLAPAEAKGKLTYLKKKWQGEHSDFAEFLRKKWQIAIDRAKSGDVIEKVDFLPVLLTKGKKAFALGIVKATGEASLPFVLKYNAEDGEVSEIIYGVEGCRRFLSAASFDNATEAGSVASGELKELWPFLVKDISVPAGADSKTVVSMKRTAPKVLRLPVVFSKGILSNAAFGNIGWWLHRRTGGLNDLIEKLFKQEKDVTGEEEFAKVKSAGTLSRRVVESLNMLKYENLNLIDKIVLKVRKIVTLGRSGIWNEKEFDRKKEELQKFSIYYLDSGKNLFWVKGKYAAAHYGVRNTSAYISAGFARKASPMQLLGVATHEALHILGFSHRHAHKIARKRRYSISFGAKELMDELAKDDQKEEARTSLLDSIYDFLKKLALSIFSYINLHPVTSFEKGTTTLLRDKLGRFIHHRGKSPEEARFVIALSDLWEKEWFILKEYGEAYKVVGSMLGFESLAANWEQIARGDLQKLVEADFLTIDEKEGPYKYRVTPEGKAECLEIRASLLEEEMGVPLSRAWIKREAKSNPSPNRERLLERLNAFIDSEIPLEYKRADLRRRLREERARGIEFDISGKCSAPIVRDGMKYWIDEYFLGVDILGLVPGHKHYARVDILREEIVHKLAHSLRDIDTSTLDGLQKLFIEETWATMGEIGVEIEVGEEGRKAMLAEFEEWAKSHGVDLNNKIGWHPIESAGHIASHPGLWTHRGGFSLEGIDFVGAELVLNVFEEFTRLTKLTTRRPLYEEIYTEREKPRIEALFYKRRKDLITFLSRISGSSEASIEGEIVAFSKLKRENIHHIYETFIEEKVAIVDRGDLFKGLDATTSLKLLNLLSLYAKCEKAELVQIKKGRSDVDYVRNCIRELPEKQVLATGIKQVEKETIDVLSKLATAHRKITITNTVNMDYKNATSEGIETGGLTPEDLEVQASLIESEIVTKRLRNSIVKGFLSWVRNVSARIAQIDTVTDDLRGYKDIIFLGAPALAEAIIHSQGIKTEDPRILEGRRIHFVNNFEGTRFEAMERLPDFSWDNTYVVVVSQGAGDSIQKENLKFLKEKVGTKITVVANFGNPLLKETPEGHRFITTDIRDNEGVVNFSGVALALAMSLAGLDYKGFVSRVEEVIKDNTEGGVGLSGSAAARFAAIVRGLGLKENHKGELVKTIMMLSYDKAAQYVINAATLSSNQRVAALRTYFGSLAPEANHNDFQIAMGKNGTLMVLISPDKWPISQEIPSTAKSRWKSTPDSKYTTARFMNISKRGIQTELTEFSDHNIGITYKPNLEGLADLVGLIQVASEIDYAVSLECGEIKGKEQDQARSIISKFDRDFKGALITKRTSRPSSEITMSDNMTTIDISGLMGEKESLLSKDELPDALAAVSKNKLTAQRSHHIGGQHIHLDEPHQAATKDEIKESLGLISLAAEDKKNFIVVGVGGPHNDPKFGVQPLRGFYADELTDKKVLFGGYTLDPTLMKELIDAVDKDPYGTMIMYISSSGETAEPDNTYHILLEHLIKKSKELHLNESAAKQRLAKEAHRIRRDPKTFIAKMEGFAQRQGLTLAQYEFVRDHILIITSKRGYLNFEASARGFRRPAHPLSSGRHAIYTLTLYMMKALGMDTDAFIKGGQAYVKDMFLTSALLSAGEKEKLQKNAKEIEAKSGDVQDELIKLAVKDINKALKRERGMKSGCGVTPSDHRISNMLNEEGELEVSSLEDFRKVVRILTEEKWEVEEIESLLGVLRGKDRSGQEEKAISQLKPFLQRDPGFLAGALMGYIGRHKGRFRVKFVDLTQLLGRAGKWRDKHLFNESLNKPHISTIAESMEIQDILSLLPALADDKESIVVLCEDTNPEDPLKAQKLALSETVKRFLRDHGIPFVVLGSRFNERAHATHILAMMQLNSGYGCTIADPPHGYSPDIQVYGEEKCGKARVAVDVAGDKDRGKEPTGIDDVIEQFTLDEELISIVKTSMTMGQRFFDIIKGKDIIKFWGRPNAQADELVEAASDGIMEALESGDILRDSVRSIITIHPITKVPKIERDLNKNGKYVVWVIPADNLIEGFNPLSPGGNPGSIIVISEVDHSGKPISEQSLNLDNTRMIIEFIHGPSDEPGVMVWGRREMFGHTETAVYSYLKVGDILIPTILKAGSHLTSVPEKKGTDAFNICDTQADLPPTVAKIWNKARDTEVRSRDFRSPVSNIAKTVNGGISEFTTNLFEALIHSIFAQGMEGHTIIIDKDGNFSDGKELYKKGIKVGDIESSDLKAFQKVVFTTGDPEWMGDLKEALEEAKKTGNKDDNKPIKLPDPIWVPDGPLLIPQNQHKLTDFLKEKAFDPDLIELVNLWTRISVEFGQEYKKTTTSKPMGTANIAGEVQYVADMVADRRYHDEVFEVLKDFLFASISEERSVTLYTKDGKYISFCDPVDGVKNLLQRFVTGNIEAITLKDGSRGVSMHFLQGSNILIFEDGENTYCTIWDGNDFRVMYKYEFGKPVPWAIKNIAVGGAEGQYGATNPDARTLVDELVTQKGYYSDNATGMLIDIARILERSLPRSFDRELKPKGENLGIYDIVPLKETVVGVLLESGGFLYLDMATARPDPEIVDLGAKMRLTELVALCKIIARVKGLGFHFGTNKSLRRIIIAHHDPNLPKLAYPCFLGVDDDVLKEINRFMWRRYVEQGFASKMQAETPFEKYDVAKDEEGYEQALDIDSEGRVYRLKKNPHVGMVRFKEPEGWRSYPVHGRVEHLDVAAIFPASTSEKKSTVYEGKRPEDKDAGRFTGTAPLFGLGIVLGLLVAIVKKWTYLVGLARAFSSTKAANLIEVFDLTEVETIKNSVRELVPDTINEVSRTFWDRPLSPLQVIVICAVIILVGSIPIVATLINDINCRKKILGLFKRIRIGDKKKSLKGRDEIEGNFLERYGFQGKLVATDQKTFFEILGDEVAKRDAKLIGVDGLAGTGKTILVNGDKQLDIGGIKQYLKTRFGRPVVILRKDYFLKDRAIRKAILDGLGSDEIYTEEPNEFYDNERYTKTLAEIFRFLNEEGPGGVLELSGAAYNRTTGKTDIDLSDLIGPIKRNAIVLVEGDYVIAKTQPKLFDVKVFVDVADDERAVERAIDRELKKPREQRQDPKAIRYRMMHIDIPSMRKLQKDGNYMEHMDFVIMNDDLKRPLIYQSSSMMELSLAGRKSRGYKGSFGPLLVVKNIFLGTFIAVGLAAVIFLLQRFAPHLLPAFLQGEFSFFTILTGILGGIIPIVFLHELGHWLVIGLTDSLEAGRFVKPRIAFRDGKGRLMIGIGRRDGSPLTTVQSLVGPLAGLAAILFALVSSFSLPVTLGITLTLLSINWSSFFWGDFERISREIVPMKSGQREIEDIRTNKEGTSSMEGATSPLPIADFGKTREILEQILKDKKISLPTDVSSGELLSMLYFADQKGHVPIIALDQGTLVVWANPDAKKENPSQEDINAATRLRLTIVYYLARGLRGKGKNVGFLLDRPALEALNDKGAEEGRVSNLVAKGLLPSDFKEVAKDVPFVAQMEETRGERGLIPEEGKVNVYVMYPAKRRDRFTVKEAMELGVRMIKSNVFFYCGSALTKGEKQFNEEQWRFIKELAEECRENNIGYVSELVFMVPVNKKAEEKEYQKTKEYMEAHAKATIEAAERMKEIKGVTLQKLAHPYPGEAAMSTFTEQERQAKLKQLSEIVPGRWLILSAAEGWETFHKKVSEAAKYGQITGMLVGRSPIKKITKKVTNGKGKQVDAIKEYSEVVRVLQEEAVAKELTLLGYIDEAPASVWQGLGLSKDGVARMPAVREELHTELQASRTSPEKEGTTSTSAADNAGTFGKDVGFLKKHFGTNNVVVLYDKSGKAQVAVVPYLQGRAMTTTFDGPNGLSLGWINRELIASGKRLSHINAYGGEDRFWIGPEGGQFSIFFPKGASPEFKFKDWQTPAVIDTEPFDSVIKSENSVTFQKQTHLTNYSGTEFDIKIDRTVRLLGRKEVKRKLRLERLPKSLKVVAYESDNGITNTGEKAWTKDNGLLSIWILGMFNPSPDTTIVIPFKPGLREKLGRIVNDDYFSKVPADRLVIGDNVLFFRGDGQHRSKIGLSPRRAKPILGSYDAANKVLTLVQYTKPRGAKDYVNSMWEIQDDPYAGDVVNSYNDGPVEPGGKPLGPFYELETSSPAEPLKPGESVSHTHRTIHLQGPEKDLDKIVRQTLGVTLEGIKNAFRGKGSPLRAAKVLIKLRKQVITEVPRKEFINTYRKGFGNRTVDYEIRGLRLVGLIDPDKGIVRLAKGYEDITEEELDKMNEAVQEIIPKGLDRWRLDDIPLEDISVIKEKLASIVRERKILFAIRSFLDGSDPNMSITNLRTLLARVSDSETLGMIIKGARDYAKFLGDDFISIRFGEGTDEITVEHIEQASRDYKAIEDKLKEVISALTDRIRELRSHKAQSHLPTARLASLRSIASVIVAVILGWASTGVAKEIIRNITIQGRILVELGNNAPAWSIYPILAFLCIGVSVGIGILVSYKLKRLEMKDKTMDQSGIRWFKLGIGSWLVAALVGGVTWIYITKVVSESTFSPLGEKTLQRLYLALTFIIGCIFGYVFNSVAIRLQVKKQRHQLKAKLAYDAIASWVKNWWANRGKVDSEKTPSEKTDTKTPKKSKERPSTRFRSILLGGLGILLIMNSDVFGAAGEIMKNGPQAGLGIGLGLGGVLTFAVAVVGVRAIYREVSLAGTGLVEVGRVRLPQVLGLESVWQALVRLFEGGRGFVAAIFRQPSKRAQLRMSWLGPREELSQEKITEIMELARRLLVKEGFYQEKSPEISQLLGWTSLPEQMKGEVGRIEKFARTVRRGYERVVVIGEEARLYAEVAATIGRKRGGYPEISVLESMRPEAVRAKIESEINLEKTLFVVSSPEPVEYLYKKLTKFYKAQGIPAGEIASQVGKHFVAITETNAPFAEEARKREFLRTFNVPEGISGSSAIFSEGALFILALAGVDIKGFVESGREGMEMCREERPEENLAIRLAAFQEAMRQAGRQIVLVLPEELGGFGEVWQGVISPLGKEGKEIIVIGEEELAAGGRFGEKTAFIRLKVGREKESLAIEQLREAGYPVLEITLPGKESIGALSYVAGFATALSYLMEISPTRKGIESSPAEDVGYQVEKVSLAKAVGSHLSIEKGEPLSEYPVRPEVVKYKGTKVFVFDFESLFDIEFVREATPSRMGIELKVKPKSKGVFKVMEKIVKAAEEVENLDGVKFAFVSSRRDVTREVMKQMLKDYMSAYGLSANVVAGVIDNNFIINERELREAGGIVGKPGSRKISTKAVFSLINEKLLLTGRTDGNGTEIKIITHSMDRWRKDGKREMMERILWVVLSPAEEGEVLSTAAGLVVAIEGKVSKWLREFIKSRYPREEAERLLSQIQKGNTIILPATPVDEEYLKGIEAQEKVYKVQA